MSLNRTASSLVRLASTLEAGNDDRRVLLAMIKEAGRLEDLHARASLLGGLEKISTDKVLRMIKSGDTAALEAALIKQGVSEELAADLVSEKVDLRLRSALVRGSNKVLGRGADELSKNQPALKGINGEDMAQVMSVGGLMWPGMRYDKRVTNHLGIKGEYVKRTKPAYPVGTNVFREVGDELRGKKFNLGFVIKKLSGLAAKRTLDWIRSADAGRYVPFAQDDRGSELVPAGYGPVNPLELLDREFYLAAISPLMTRELGSSPAQLRIWNALMEGLKKGQNFLSVSARGTNKGDVAVKGTDLQKFMADLYADEVDAATGEPLPIPSTQAIGRVFTKKLLPKMRESLANLSDDQLAKGLPPEDRSLMDNKDLRSVYLSEVRRRRASSVPPRGALLRLASLFPRGSRERKLLLASAK